VSHKKIVELHVKELTRFTDLGHVDSVLVTPILGERFALGAFELVDPLDALPFGTCEENAIAYVADEYARFLTRHGVALDVPAIARRVYAATG
jgi:hypothetical protein